MSEKKPMPDWALKQQWEMGARVARLRGWDVCPQEYAKLAANKPRRCEACKRDKNSLGKPIRIAIDHDHHTGKFRGYLCSRCNGSLSHHLQKYLVSKGWKRPGPEGGVEFWET